MKKLLKAIIFGLVAIVVVVVGGAYTLPGTARVERAAVINAEPAKIYAIVADLKRMKDWSPVLLADPKMDIRYEGAASGVGQKVIWISANPQVGSGSQTILDVVPDQQVTTELDRGGLGKVRETMVLAPVTGGTSVVIRFEKELSGVGERWLGLLFDKTFGADYQKGLQNLKQLAETEAGGG